MSEFREPVVAALVVLLEATADLHLYLDQDWSEIALRVQPKTGSWLALDVTPAEVRAAVERVRKP